ncbi:peptidyl-tRNA hydrolase 2 [Trichomonascus vanleenenianus]|uniref:aminoacyl-tRNA hydrolase n=1 Tax=Trichomonascus vanleenenianus TaxID=2268995 RepID=UPI003ECADF27
MGNVQAYSPLLICTLLAGLAGFYIGTKVSPANDFDSDDEFESEGEEEQEQVSTSEECKMVLVVRMDLKMGKGKAAAQCAHAAVACYKAAKRRHPAYVKRWEEWGQMKVTLQCPNEEEIELLRGIAESLNITNRLIHDAGRTQIAAGSATVLGLGPAPKSLLDQVTGSLKLY